MDARLEWQTTHADLALLGPDLASDDGLDTAVILSLYSDARASAADGLAADDDPRGWWGDSYAAHPGDVTGSKLWLLSREKQLPRVRQAAQQYAEEALQWLLDDGVAAAVNVTATYIAPGVLDLTVQIARPQRGDTFSRRYQYVWSSPDAV